MKSTHEKASVPATSKNLPALYRGKYTVTSMELIVLFLSEKTGVCVHGRNTCAVGSYSTEHLSCFDEKNWERLPDGDSVTLSN